MGNRILWTVVAFLFSAAALAEPVAVQFDQIPVKDFAKVVYGDILKTGYVVHESVESAKISVYFPKSEPKQIERLAVDALKASGLAAESVGGVVVINKPKAPESEVIIYRPKFRAVSYLSELLVAAFPGVQIGGRRQMSNVPMNQYGYASQGQGYANQPGQMMQGSMPITGEQGVSGLFDRVSADVLVARIEPERARALRSLIDQLDIEQNEVVIRAVAYEVQKGHKEGSALDLVWGLLKSKIGIDLKGKLAGADSTVSIKIGGIDAVLGALDSDTRFKSLSRPAVRVKSGSMARFSVGSDVPVLGAVVTQNNGGSAVQSVEYRSSGVLLDVTPQVRQGRVDVKLKQEYSTFVQTITGVQNSPTLNKRSAETELSIEPGEVVFIGGLEAEENTDSSQAFYGLPFGKSKERKQNETVLMLEVQRI